MVISTGTGCLPTSLELEAAEAVGLLDRRRELQVDRGVGRRARRAAVRVAARGRRVRALERVAAAAVPAAVATAALAVERAELVLRVDEVDVVELEEAALPETASRLLLVLYKPLCELKEDLLRCTRGEREREEG